jgi:hypothetical protein
MKIKARLYFLLTLTNPGSGLSAQPLIATCSSPLLCLFKSVAIQDCESRFPEAFTPGDRVADEAELIPLYPLLDVFIPESGDSVGN